MSAMFFWASLYFFSGMARQDIHMNANYGEVNLTDNLTSKVFYPFISLEEIPGMDNEHYCYGEILVPLNFEKHYRSGEGIRIVIPYIPEYKQLSVRFLFDTGDGSSQYMINRVNNGLWFTIVQESGALHLSEFPLFNEEGIFHLVFHDAGTLLLYSGAESDFIIKPSLKQNEVFMLKSLTGNLYQYPTTGVGLVNYLHGNFETSGLSAKLLKEFSDDGMIINNAYMDSLTGELVLDVTEKE